jgi:hypothetical protein
VALKTVFEREWTAFWNLLIKVADSVSELFLLIAGKIGDRKRKIGIKRLAGVFRLINDKIKVVRARVFERLNVSCKVLGADESK